MTPQTFERFLAKIYPAPSGCWEWTASLNKADRGYGQLRVKGYRHLAHRISYEHFVGPIPSWLEIDHLCKNTVCVNPTHLETVTRAVNLSRSTFGVAGTMASRRIAAMRTHCLKGHPLANNVYLYQLKCGRVMRFCRTCRGAAALRARMAA